MTAPAVTVPPGLAFPRGLPALAAFSTAALGAGLGRALVTTYLPVLLERIRDAPGLIGTVMVVNAAAGFAVPLVIGVWSDRLVRRGRGRAGPFILGGSAVTALGLVAIALGSGSSFAALALFAAVAYVGLNAITTAHRALIPESFEPARRAQATAAEELSMLAGGLVGVVGGGVLVEVASWAPFALGAASLPLLALPTVARLRDVRPVAMPEREERPGVRSLARLARRPGVRLVLAAQALWVLGYLGLPPFFVLYAEHVLDVSPAGAGAALAVFGVATGAAMLAAGALRPTAHAALLLLGVALMGGGLVSVAPASTLLTAAPGLAAAAVGFGVVSTLGFPVLCRLVPPGVEGESTALYFSVRALAAAVAVPAAGWTIAVTGSYRALLVYGGAVTLLGLVPLAVLTVGERAARALGRAALVTGAAVGVLGFGLAMAKTPAAMLDERVFRLLEGLGGTPLPLDVTLVDPHYQNYAVLTVVAVVATRLRGGSAVRAFLLVAGSAALSFAGVRAMWAVWERPRPQEVLGSVAANAHDWAPYPSFPSGHVAVTVAIAAAAGGAVPRLRVPLWLYVGFVAVTRVTYGAHFPSDVLGGLALGLLASVAVDALVRAGDRTRRPRLGMPMDSRRLLALARAWSVAAVLFFISLLELVGPPHGPEGGLFAPATEYAIHHALVDILGIAVVMAWVWTATGGLMMLLAAVAIGVLARLEYSPEAGLLACLAIFVPGLIFVLVSPRTATVGRKAAALGFAAGLLALGGVAGERVHAAVFGPSHPESALRPLPPSDVEWIWAGALTPTSVTVNAKLARDGAARLLVSERPSLETATQSPSRRAAEDTNDRTVSFPVSGLRPEHRYFYAVQVDGRIDRTRSGTFRTPADGAFSFTIAVGGCARTGSNGAVFDAIRSAKPLLYLILGDFFYANIAGDDERSFQAAYAKSLTAPAQAALYRSVPVAYVWDDHDFGPNDADRTAASRPAAQRTYRQAVPQYPLAAGATGPIFQSFTIGRVRFVLTDSRSERDPGRTMLGATQKAWLKRELRRARLRRQLVVWATSVPWIAAPDAGADSWAGYTRERRELAKFVAAEQIGPLLMLAGDAHMLAIDDGSHSDYSGRGRGRGFPVMHAAALDRPGELKGGPYSEGAVPGGGQFGLVTFDDDGRSITVRLSGRDYRDRELIAYSFDAGDLLR